MEKSWRERLLRPAAAVLNDRVIGGLAILAVASSVYPLLFDVSDTVAWALDWFEWAVVLTFVAEYAVHLGLADDKRAFVVNGWRLLELGIIVVCVLTLLPAVDDSLRLAGVHLWPARQEYAESSAAGRCAAGSGAGAADVFGPLGRELEGAAAGVAGICHARRRTVRWLARCL